MASRLAGATSPYLLQHNDNPVDWYEWPWRSDAEPGEVRVIVGGGGARRRHSARRAAGDRPCQSRSWSGWVTGRSQTKPRHT